MPIKFRLAKPPRKRRWQKGSVHVAGKREKYWRLEWRDRIIDADGTERDVHRSENLGLISEVTQEEARAAADRIVAKSDSVVPFPMESRVLASSCRNGAAAEVLVSWDLLQKGYEVYRALNPAAPCDLLAMRDGKIERIEVKLSDFNLSGQPVCDIKRNAGKFDRLAVVTRKGQIVYKTHAEVFQKTTENTVQC